LGLGIIFFDAAPFLIYAAAIFTVPAVFDFFKARKSGLIVGKNTISWFSNYCNGSISSEEICYVLLNTRLDLNVRTTGALVNRQIIYLPFDVIPPVNPFSKILFDRGIRLEQHHFSLFGLT